MSRNRSGPGVQPSSAGLKQLVPRPSPYASVARRRLQCGPGSQLPVRVGPAPATTATGVTNAPRLVNSLRKFTPKRCDRGCGPSPSCRRSLSMVDLSEAAGVGAPLHSTRSDNGCGRGSNSRRNSHGNTGRSNAPSISPIIDGEPSLSRSSTHQLNNQDEAQQRQHQAAGIVCRALAVNAWRRRRTETVELRSELADLAQQLEHLRIQIVVLRRLLDNENARVAALAGELHRAKAHSDELSRERDQLVEDKKLAEGEAQKQLEISEERFVAAENLRNELKSARDQLEALDKQINKDREKLLKLREDKKILLEKLSASEGLVANRTLSAERAEIALEDTQLQLATQMALANSLQEEVNRFRALLEEKEKEKSELESLLKGLEEKNQSVEDRLKFHEESERVLTSRLSDLEDQLSDQETKIKCMESAYHSQL
ncbi:hypothetical protein QAD02_004474 [Eretmocerus hayati]|uniref:Uncharacterized protein n=1 Tax=Eretmocerus hayati TaxID=131215 RepID=A0ACC2NSL0_9HYME|nr:hypothetical protein QAD02_004474 [Eretmocerus hayati]